MNNKEDNPNNQEGLGGEPSPSEIIRQMMDKLGELLRDRQNKNGNIIINYYKSVGQRIDSVTTQNFASDKWLKTPSEAPADDTKQEERETKEETPPPGVMAWAVEKTIREGHWWGNVSWSVVYRIYQMKGYQGSVSQFVRDVSTWPFTVHVSFDCNDDAVGKPIRSGKILRSLDKWAEDGASPQFVILGKALMQALSCKNLAAIMNTNNH